MDLITKVFHYIDTRSILSKPEKAEVKRFIEQDILFSGSKLSYDIAIARVQGYSLALIGDRLFALEV